MSNDLKVIMLSEYAKEKMKRGRASLEMEPAMVEKLQMRGSRNMATEDTMTGYIQIEDIVSRLSDVIRCSYNKSIDKEDIMDLLVNNEEMKDTGMTLDDIITKLVKEY